MPRSAKRLPRALRAGLIARKVELILHLGDFTSFEVAQQFESIAPFEAVAGNNDGEAIRARYGRKKIVAAGGFKIGMVHGDGHGRNTLDRSRRTFAQDKVDVIAFGHSHVPFCGVHDGVLMINPGSPTDKRRNPAFSYALLGLDGSQINPELIFFQDKR